MSYADAVAPAWGDNKEESAHVEHLSCGLIGERMGASFRRETYEGLSVGKTGYAGFRLLRRTLPPKDQRSPRGADTKALKAGYECWCLPLSVLSVRASPLGDNKEEDQGSRGAHASHCGLSRGTLFQGVESSPMLVSVMRAPPCHVSPEATDRFFPLIDKDGFV